MATRSRAQDSPAPSSLPAKPKLPDVKYVAEQAYRDWFGKDVQETPTVSYVWTADQFGHFGLGFQITYALSWIAQTFGFTSPWVVVALAALNVTVWVVKEWFDFLRELRKSREAKSVFKFNAREILWNVFTALFYIAVGAIVAGAAAIKPLYGLVSLLLIAPPFVLLAIWWLRRKITFQQAGLPYLYRLATFPNEVDRATAEQLVEISKPTGVSASGGTTASSAASSSQAMHFVIAGTLGSGKSSLAVGVGTEFAFRMGIGRYTTLVKLLESAIRSDGDGSPPHEFDDGRILWPWQTADLLIIDDVDLHLDLFGLVPAGESPAALNQRLKTALETQIDPAVLKDLGRRRTVWVLGDVQGAALTRWRDGIADIIGVNPEEIRTLDLTMKVSDVLLRKRDLPGPVEQVPQW